MSRSGYSDDCEYLGLYRNAVDRAIKGKRGQAFLRELVATLDAMPEKKLISGQFQNQDKEVCTLGAIFTSRNLRMPDDYEDAGEVGESLGIAAALAAEIEYMNDEWFSVETPEQRWQRMRQWAEDNLK